MGLFYLLFLFLEFIFFYYKNNSFWFYLFGVFGLVIFFITILKSDILSPLNKLWFKFGLLLITEDENLLFGIDKLKLIRSRIPAITHVDYSARIQTVDKFTNPLYYALISKFKEKTGCSLVINTSFNFRGEPIICAPTDAFKCFMGTEIDVLALGNYVLYKEHQDESLEENYKERYEHD